MKPTEVAASYDKLVERFNAPSMRHYGVAQVKRAIGFARSKGVALDVGCGTGRLTGVLEESGFRPVGIDLSENMLLLAREQHPNAEFIKADICEWPLPAQYDLIVAWDSIWHVPLDKQEAVLRKLCNGLVPGAVIVFTAGGVDEPDERHDSAMGTPMYHSSLGVPRILGLLDECDCICRHLEYDQDMKKHVYIVAQKAAS